MSTTIDTLVVDIQSTSTSAVASIESLAASLEKMKRSTISSTAVKNLNALTTALKNLTPVSSSANKLSAMADSLAKLSAVGSLRGVVSQLNSLAPAMRSLSGIDLTGVGDKIENLARDIAPLSEVKAGGIGTIANALTKLQNIDLDKIRFDDTKVANFVAEIKKLDDAIGPLSTKMVSVGNAFKAVNSSANSAGNGVKGFGKKVNTTTLNLASLVTVLQGIKAALMPIVRLLSSAIGDAMEWDGISYQFGNAFGEQADEYARRITEITDALDINKQTFMETSAMATSMLKGFGVGSKDAREMGLGYTELAYDIWAAYNNVYKSLDGADGAMAAVRSAIAGEVEPIRRAGFTIVESQLEMTAANYGIAYSSEKATEAQKSYLRYLTLVDQAQTKGIVGAYAKEMNTAEGLTRTLTQQVKSLSQAFGSLFLPILVKVMPWLQAFIELLTEAVHRVAAFFGISIQDISDTWGGGGTALEGVGNAAENATDSLGDTAGAVKDTTDALKDLKKATIGIDELNVISPPTASSGSGSGSGSGAGGAGDLSAFEGLDIGSLWDESIFDSIQFQVDNIKGKLEEALSVLTAVISGFMLAIGTILVVSGANIPLGLGLMAVGAVGLVATIAENWDGMSEQLAKTLTVITSVLGGFLLAIGAFLAFSGVNVGLGAALMVAGAVSLATAATINWKFLEGDLKNTLSILTGIVAGGLLAMGALFAFTGVDVKLGIALMAAGAVGLVTAAGLNWDSMSEPLRKAIGTLEAIVGGALLTFGAILALTGANIPLGIGMIAAGAISLASAVALNWDSLTSDLKNTIATITTLVSGALLGVGAILALTGVNVPLGIAMIAAGAVGIIAAAPVNWSSLTATIKKVLKEIGAAVGIALLAVGAVLAFTGVALPIGIALMAAGAVSLVSAVALNWNSIVTSVKNVLQKIGIVAGAAMLALGVVLVCTGVGIPLGIGLIAAGAASLVSGVALNWNSISAKIKEVIGKIGEWLNKYGLLVLGVILCLTGYGIPLGVALIKKAKSGETVSSLGNGLLNTIKTKWGEVKNWWNNKKGSLKSYTPSIGSIRDKISSAWSSAKKWWNTKKGSMSFTPSIGSISGKLKSAWNTAKTWWKNNVKLSIPSLSLKVTYSKATGWKKAVVKALGLDGWPSLKFAANGGIFDAGSLIWAGEAGAEVVANAGGGKTGVMNVAQMQEAVYEGVYSAVVAAMRSTSGNGSQDVHVYLDSREITASVEKRQRERGASLMGNQVYAY